METKKLPPNYVVHIKPPSEAHRPSYVSKSEVSSFDKRQMFGSKQGLNDPSHSLANYSTQMKKTTSADLVLSDSQFPRADYHVHQRSASAGPNIVSTLGRRTSQDSTSSQPPIDTHERPKSVLPHSHMAENKVQPVPLYLKKDLVPMVFNPPPALHKRVHSIGLSRYDGSGSAVANHPEPAMSGFTDVEHVSPWTVLPETTEKFLNMTVTRPAASTAPKPAKIWDKFFTRSGSAQSQLSRSGSNSTIDSAEHTSKPNVTSLKKLIFANHRPFSEFHTTDLNALSLDEGFNSGLALKSASADASTPLEEGKSWNSEDQITNSRSTVEFESNQSLDSAGGGHRSNIFDTSPDRFCINTTVDYENNLLSPFDVPQERKPSRTRSNTTSALDTSPVRTDSPSPRKNTRRERNNQRIAAILIPSRIFEFFAIVSLEKSDVGSIAPRISYRYSPEAARSPKAKIDPVLLANIPLFCFPELGTDVNEAALSSLLMLSGKELAKETFSFVITNSDRTKKFGYCRRVASKTGSKFPEVLCMICPLGCFSLYKQILDVVERYYDDNKSLDKVLDAILSKPFPKPGKSISFRVLDSVDSHEYLIRRPVDLTSFEHVQVYRLLHCLGLTGLNSMLRSNSAFLKLTTLVSALILERRILFVSKSLQKLSECCNAAMSMIYPMEWQHAFIPILPRQLIDFVCSPTPFLMGILRADISRIVPGFDKQKSSTEDADIIPVDDVLIIDLDSSNVLRNDTEEHDKQFLPPYLVARLKEFLEHAFSVSKSIKISETENNSSLNYALFDAFLSFFTLYLGAYREFMEVDIETAQIKKAGSTQEEEDGPSQVRVQFSGQNFVEYHPLIASPGNPAWLQVPAHLDASSAKKYVPKSTQRTALKNSIITLRESQNFQNFIQEREEAFQYHYQLHLDKSEGTQKEVALKAPTTTPSTELPSGLRYYYQLSQSKFEKKVTKLETEAQNYAPQ